MVIVNWSENNAWQETLLFPIAPQSPCGPDEQVTCGDENRIGTNP